MANTGFVNFYADVIRRRIGAGLFDEGLTVAEADFEYPWRRPPKYCLEVQRILRIRDTVFGPELPQGTALGRCHPTGTLHKATNRSSSFLLVGGQRYLHFRALRQS